MDELALKQAERADQELRAKNDRGPLHGIPCGIKDIFSYPGYPTTWGVGQYRDRVIDVKAAVAERLENAGAVLVAKLATNTLAGGSVLWYRGITRNPWNPRRDAGGSSSGPAAAVRRRTRRLFHRHRNHGKPHRPFHSLRCGGTETDVRTRKPIWLHATLLVARQDRANLPRALTTAVWCSPRFTVPIRATRHRLTGRTSGLRRGSFPRFEWGTSQRGAKMKQRDRSSSPARAGRETRPRRATQHEKGLRTAEE